MQKAHAVQSRVQSTVQSIVQSIVQSSPGFTASCLISGLDYWTGLLDWTTGLTILPQKSIQPLACTIVRSRKVEVCSKLGRANTLLWYHDCYCWCSNGSILLQLIQQLTRALTHCMVEYGKGYHWHKPSMCSYMGLHIYMYAATISPPLSALLCSQFLTPQRKFTP